MIKEIATQQIAIKQTLQALAGEASSSQGILTPQHAPTPNNPEWAREGSIPAYRSRRPRRDFPTFEGEEVHKWLYKCNQYFDLEEIPENDKLKLASYYLDGMALYWHQNYTRNLEGQELTWLEYVDALCCRFGGQRDPLEELTEHKQEGDLEGYIKDFDMLWNRAQISEKQALVFFLGGLEIEIKNLVKMFEPKSLKQAYNLARLHNNTLTHRKVTPHFPKSQGQVAHNPYSARDNYSANLNQTNPIPLKTSSPALLPTPTNFPPNNPRPIKPIRTKEMDDRRAKGLCFWCDERFVPGHRCKNRRLYSLCIVDDEGDNIEEETMETMSMEALTPHLSLQAIHDTAGCQTIKVWGKIDRDPIFILIDSGSTHNFINAEVARKLECLMTQIKPREVEAANGGTISCTAVCKNLQWMMQGVQFQADVFVMKLQKYDMVLGIQWLKLLGNVLSNYEDGWLSFWWRNREVTLRGENPKLAQSIQLEELNGLLGTEHLLSEVRLCSLRMVGKADLERPAPEIPPTFKGTKDSPVEAVDQYLTQQEDMLELIKSNLLKSQIRMTQQVNKKRGERSFSVGNLVHLKLQPYRQQSVHKQKLYKLSAKYYGSYAIIEKIGTVAYKLQLPATAIIYPVFHVSQLKKHGGNHVMQTDLPIRLKKSLLQPQSISERRRVKKGNAATTQFRIMWKDLPWSEATWEDAVEFGWRFPHFHLEDKVDFHGQGIVTN